VVSDSVPYNHLFYFVLCYRLFDRFHLLPLLHQAVPAQAGMDFIRYGSISEFPAPVVSSSYVNTKLSTDFLLQKNIKKTANTNSFKDSLHPCNGLLSHWM
jgi:hypothetical protein